MKISIKRTWRLLTVHIVSNVATLYISSQVLCGFFSKVMLSQWATFEIWIPHHSCNVRYTVAHCHTQVGLAIVVLLFASVELSSWLALMRLAVECPPPDWMKDSRRYQSYLVRNAWRWNLLCSRRMRVLYKPPDSARLSLSVPFCCWDIWGTYAFIYSAAAVNHCRKWSGTFW